MREKKTEWRLKRELLCVEAWQTVPHTHIWKEDTISVCVSECVYVCVRMCARASRNGRSATFQIIPHTGGSTLSLYTPGLAGLTHHKSLWSMLVCNCPDSVKQTTAPVYHRLFNKKFCLETLNLQLLEQTTSFITKKYIQPTRRINQISTDVYQDSKTLIHRIKVVMLL